MIHYISPTGAGDAWVVNELEIVQDAGIPFELHALRRARATFHSSEWGQSLFASASVIYPIRATDGLLMLGAPFRFGTAFFQALANAIFGQRESLRNRVASLGHFFVAAAWATRLLKSGKPVSHIHSQWIHAAGTVGMYGAWLLNVPFSFTGHAADLYRERVALNDKIRRAKFIGCISSHHEQFFLEQGARPEQLRRVYCGINISSFAPAELPPVEQGLKIRAAGRLVEKKGFEYLIDSCHILKQRGVPFECRIGGSGPLEEELRHQVSRLHLEDEIEITGEALKQENIPAFMHSGNVFCLPCVWAKDNDVDGLPQMTMEAMACGLPAVSTRLVGIPDLVIDGKTGLLVEPRNAAELADAISSLTDPSLAARLAAAGREHVIDTFEIKHALQPLLNEYRRILGKDEARSGKGVGILFCRAENS
ncbi:MAG: glycosyltransferase [Fuerstiella sp.]